MTKWIGLILKQISFHIDITDWRSIADESEIYYLRRYYDRNQTNKWYC